MASVRLDAKDLKAWERADAYEERLNRGPAPWIKKEIVE